MTFDEWFKGYEKEHNKYSSLSNNLSKHDLKQAWNAAVKACQHHLVMIDWDFSCCYPQHCLEDLKTK